MTTMEQNKQVEGQKHTVNVKHTVNFSENNCTTPDV